MITGRAGWKVWCAAAAFLTSWGHADAAPWRAAEQPELKQALEKAPVLKTESLGEPARGVNVWERWMVPEPGRQELGRAPGVLQGVLRADVALRRRPGHRRR